MGEDSLLGLSVGQQLLLIGIVGAVLVIAGYSMSGRVTSAYNPTVVAIGVVCVLYALTRGAYEAVFGG